VALGAADTLTAGCLTGGAEQSQLLPTVLSSVLIRCHQVCYYLISPPWESSNSHQNTLSRLLVLPPSFSLALPVSLAGCQRSESERALEKWILGDGMNRFPLSGTAECF